MKIELFVDEKELENAVLNGYEAVSLFRHKTVAYGNAVSAGYKPKIIKVFLEWKEPEENK